MSSSTHEMKELKGKRKRSFSAPKQKKRKREQALSLSDKENCLSDLENCLKNFLGPEVSLSKILRLCGIQTTQTGGREGGTSQQTLDGEAASARSARHPAAELYRRLGLQHVQHVGAGELRATFTKPSVYDLSDRQRRRLIRVSTPLVKVGR